MVFPEWNGTCGMEPERFGRNLAEKSGTDRDLKWDEICSVLFRFLNWYGMFRPFRAERNGIDNLAIKHSVSGVCGLATTHDSSHQKIWVTLDGLWTTSSNDHGNEIIDERYMCTSILAVWTLERVASSSSSSSSSNTAIVLV